MSFESVIESVIPLNFLFLVGAQMPVKQSCSLSFSVYFQLLQYDPTYSCTFNKYFKGRHGLFYLTNPAAYNIASMVRPSGNKR